MDRQSTKHETYEERHLDSHLCSHGKFTCLKSAFWFGFSPRNSHSYHQHSYEKNILNFSTKKLPLQVIIQSLRESGVFGSVIAKAAQATISKDNFLKSVESSNSTRNSRSEMISSRKIDAGGVSQATARRILEVIDDSIPSAIPPLSPPSHDHADWLHYIILVFDYLLAMVRIVEKKNQFGQW